MPNIEEHIRQAQHEGKFDDLSGKGKPIKLDEDPHADPEWQLAFRILKDAGFSLPWIEDLKKIEADIEAARAGLRHVREWCQKAQVEGMPVHSIHREWEGALQCFQDRVAALNKRIRDVNLQVPNTRFQRPMLNMAREMRRVEEK